MPRASHAQKVERLNHARILLRQGEPLSAAVQRLAQDCTLSPRQAYRYLTQVPHRRHHAAAVPRARMGRQQPPGVLQEVVSIHCGREDRAVAGASGWLSRAAVREYHAEPIAIRATAPNRMGALRRDLKVQENVALVFTTVMDELVRGLVDARDQCFGRGGNACPRRAPALAGQGHFSCLILATVND
jgi:hypothetical protein